MENVIQGTVVSIYPAQTGQSAKGAWTKRVFVVDVQDGDYVKKLAFDVMQEKPLENLGKLAEGEQVEVKFNIDCREHNGTWYTNLKAWYIRSTGSVNHSAAKSGEQNDMPF